MRIYLSILSIIFFASLSFATDVTLDDVESRDTINPTHFNQVKSAVNSKLDSAGDTMTGDLDMDDNDLDNVGDIDAATGTFSGSVTIAGADARRSVADYTDLAAITGMADGDEIWVEGRSADGDGGEGWFWYDSDNAGTADDGVIIDAAGSGDGRWVRKYSGSVNVLWWGTGYAAFQSAFDLSISDNTIGSVYVPGGAYTITSQVTYDTSAIDSNTDGRLRVYGDGMATKITVTGLADSAILYTGDNTYAASYLYIDDIYMLGDGTAGSVGIEIDGGSAFNKFENIVIAGFETGLETTDTDQTNLVNCTFRWNDNGVKLNGADSVTGSNIWQFFGCTIANNSETGIHINQPNNVCFFGGSIQYNGSIGGGTNEYGVFLDKMVAAGPGYGSVGFYTVVFEGNGGISDVKIARDTSQGLMNVLIENCSFMRTSRYATYSIYETGASTGDRYAIRDCSFKHSAAYTPDAGRPRLNFSIPESTLFIDDSNFFSSGTEDPDETSEWTTLNTRKKSKTISASADDVDVSGVNILYVNTASGDVTIGGIVGGIPQQELSIIKIASSNDIIIENNEGTGNQDIFTNVQGTDVTIDWLGGVDLIFYGADWYPVVPAGDSFGDMDLHDNDLNNVGDIDAATGTFSGQIYLSSETETCAAEAGTADPTVIITFIVSDGDADTDEDTVGLVDGTVVGQQKIFVFKTDTDSGDSVNVTPSNASFTDILFDTVGEGCTMVWDGSNWHIVSNNGGDIT